MPGCLRSLQLALQNSAKRNSFKIISKKSSTSRSVSTLRVVLGVSETEGDTPCPRREVILINLLKVKPGKQDALIALLKQNTDTVVRTLHGWKTTRLIAARDGAGVVIYSEWESPAAVEAMRSDPRMKAYFPRIIELASLDSIVGSAVSSETR
jgi:quinol monooxygenase YgiN